MAAFPLSPDERALVGAAVTAAERDTDGEIVTIVTKRSSEYYDVALIAGALAMLLVAAIATVDARLLDLPLAPWSDGWAEAPSMTARLAVLLVVQALVFGLVLLVLRNPRWRIALTPKCVCARRVRTRAIRYFKVGAEKRTQARVGVLLYLSLDERQAEIVADAAIHAAVPPERWGDAMVALVDEVRSGRPAQGMAAAVGAIGAIVAEHFPKTEDDRNELPDRLIEL